MGPTTTTTTFMESWSMKMQESKSHECAAPMESRMVNEKCWTNCKDPDKV